MSENVTAAVAFREDTLELCQMTRVSADEVAERTEYFTVSLRRRSQTGDEIASCQVAIIDTNGGEVLVIIIAPFLSLLHPRSLRLLCSSCS